MSSSFKRRLTALEQQAGATGEPDDSANLWVLSWCLAHGSQQWGQVDEHLQERVKLYLMSPEGGEEILRCLAENEDDPLPDQAEARLQMLLAGFPNGEVPDRVEQRLQRLLSEPTVAAAGTNGAHRNGAVTPP